MHDPLARLAPYADALAWPLLHLLGKERRTSSRELRNGALGKRSGFGTNEKDIK